MHPLAKLSYEKNPKFKNKTNYSKSQQTTETKPFFNFIKGSKF
jgi:hypothetical protein